jgi:hypothetical protein
LRIRAISLQPAPALRERTACRARQGEPLRVGKTAVKFNIPEAEAVDQLKDLICEHGKWVESAREGAALEPAS